MKEKGDDFEMFMPKTAKNECRVKTKVYRKKHWSYVPKPSGPNKVTIDRDCYTSGSNVSLIVSGSS